MAGQDEPQSQRLAEGSRTGEAEQSDKDERNGEDNQNEEGHARGQIDDFEVYVEDNEHYVQIPGSDASEDDGNNDSRFQCEHCQKSYASITSLQRHERDKKSICYRSKTGGGNLKRRPVKKDESWSCTRCEEILASKYSVERHINESCWKICDQCCENDGGLGCDGHKTAGDCLNCKVKGCRCTKRTGPVYGTNIERITDEISQHLCNGPRPAGRSKRAPQSPAARPQSQPASKRVASGATFSPTSLDITEQRMQARRMCRPPDNLDTNINGFARIIPPSAPSNALPHSPPFTVAAQEFPGAIHPRTSINRAERAREASTIDNGPNEMIPQRSVSFALDSRRYPCLRPHSGFGSFGMAGSNFDRIQRITTRMVQAKGHPTADLRSRDSLPSLHTSDLSHIDFGATYPVISRVEHIRAAINHPVSHDRPDNPIGRAFVVSNPGSRLPNPAVNPAAKEQDTASKAGEKVNKENHEACQKKMQVLQDCAENAIGELQHRADLLNVLNMRVARLNKWNRQLVLENNEFAQRIAEYQLLIGRQHSRYLVESNGSADAHSAIVPQRYQNPRPRQVALQPQRARRQFTAGSGPRFTQVSASHDHNASPLDPLLHQTAPGRARALYPGSLQPLQGSGLPAAPAIPPTSGTTISSDPQPACGLYRVPARPRLVFPNPLLRSNGTPVPSSAEGLVRQASPKIDAASTKAGSQEGS